MRLVLAVAGASGSIYAARLLKAILPTEGETFFIMSPTSIRIFREEYECDVETPQDVLNYVQQKWNLETKHTILHRNFHDVGADIASGSNVWDAMVVIPTSMKTIASINAGLTENLIERAADVTLKERRPLILVPRETPYNRIHLRNMLELSDAGATIFPASPGFYQNPKTLDDLGDFMASRVLQHIGWQDPLYPRWNPGR